MFVCAMNVCRSPLMQATFVEALEAQQARGGWTVSSRGTLVSRREAMCDVAASLIEPESERTAFEASHSSAPLALTQLSVQSMVLVATRAERARVASLAPALRSRTFTLREAVYLGESPPTTAETDAIMRARRPGEQPRLAAYAELLHARRGLLQPPVSKFSAPFLNRTDPLDIPDVHHEKPRRHVAALKFTQATVRTLHRQLSDFLPN